MPKRLANFPYISNILLQTCKVYIATAPMEIKHTNILLVITFDQEALLH